MKTKYRRIMAPLKTHGGKHYLAPKIIGLMPPHRTYVEPYAGGLSVLLAKDPANISEVVNDIDRDLTNFWRVMTHEALYEKFYRLVEATPFSEAAWNDCRKQLAKFADDDSTDPKVVRAACFFVVCRQSMAGRRDTFAPITQSRLRRGMNEQASAWLSAVEGLPEVYQRLRRVVIYDREATRVVAEFDDPSVVQYLDPPYPADTRVSTDVYAHEMTVKQHAELLEVVRHSKAKILLSSYRNPRYDRRLKDWNLHVFDVPNNASHKRTKERKQEVVYTNF